VKRVVLDASALMTFFQGRPGAEKVKELFESAAEGKKELLMSVVNWGEVYYSIWRDRGREDAEKALTYIGQLPIEIVHADMELTRLAAELKAQYKLPYADCFAAALAKGRKAIVATSDGDFGAVRDLIPLLEV
jgi:predicted nucleic acid-binding protein